jgi:hypothetical protein
MSDAVPLPVGVKVILGPVGNSPGPEVTVSVTSTLLLIGLPAESTTLTSSQASCVPSTAESIVVLEGANEALAAATNALEKYKSQLRRCSTMPAYFGRRALALLVSEAVWVSAATDRRFSLLSAIDRCSETVDSETVSSWAMNLLE